MANCVTENHAKLGRWIRDRVLARHDLTEHVRDPHDGDRRQCQQHELEVGIVVGRRDDYGAHDYRSVDHLRTHQEPPGTVRRRRRPNVPCFPRSSRHGLNYAADGSPDCGIAQATWKNSRSVVWLPQISGCPPKRRHSGSASRSPQVRSSVTHAPPGIKEDS
jgi:hypothetical protein